MSMKSRLPFYLWVVGDGSSTAITVTNATAAFGFQVSGNGDISPGFNISSMLPTAVANVTSACGGTISASLGGVPSGTTTTFTYTVALGNGVIDVLSGDFYF